MKRNLMVLALACVLSACGGGGSNNNGGGNNGGGNDNNTVPLPGSKNTGKGSDILHLTNHDNIYYLGVIHGKRTASSSFTYIDTDTSSITPTNADGYLSLAIHCYVRGGGIEFTIYDLKIKGSRELDLQCNAQLPSGLNSDTLEASTVSNYTLHTAGFMGSNVANVPVPYAADMNTNSYNDPLLNFKPKFNDYDDRTIWGLYYSSDSAILSVYEKSIWGDVRKQSTNYNNPQQPGVAYELPYDPNHNKNHELTLLDTPSARFYSLDYYSPDRFTNPLRTSRQISTESSLAALIPSNLKTEKDYYVEQFISEKGYVYRHISTTPKGAALFGDNGTFKGNSDLGNINLILSSNGQVSYNEPNSIESSLDLVGREISITYVTGVGGQMMKMHYFSELDDDFVLSNDFENMFGSTSLSISMESLFPKYEGIAFNDSKIFSKIIRFFYSNGIAGEGNVTMYTSQY